MVQKIVAFVLLLLAVPSTADWVEDRVVVDVNSTDPLEMGNALTVFPDMLNWLNAHNLTGASRLQVKRLTGRIAIYKWANDATCTVADPGTIAPAEMSSAHTDFFFTNKPADLWHLDTVLTKPSPCAVARETTPPKFNHYRIK